MFCSFSGFHSMTEPRNGGCEPRVVCEEVPVDRSQSELIVSYPQCVEVHRCGGCCQEPQFPCLPVRQVPVTFSPVSRTTTLFIIDMLFLSISYF